MCVKCLYSLYQYTTSEEHLSLLFIALSSVQDLAARNVLVGEGETCKVSDFGLLCELPEGDSVYQSAANLPLPIRWMSPEAIFQRSFSPASDVWSFGVLQWEMFHPSEQPYGKINNLECVTKVGGGWPSAVHGRECCSACVHDVSECGSLLHSGTQ